MNHIRIPDWQSRGRRFEPCTGIFHLEIKSLDRMNLKFVLTIDDEARPKTDLIDLMFNRISRFVKNNNYGNGVRELLISVQIINPPEGYEHMYRDIKPRFIKNRVITNKLTGEKIHIDRQFHYGIKIEGKLFSTFARETDDESEKVLASEIVKSLSNLDKLPKTIRDFNKDKFKLDIQNTLCQ